MKLNNKGLSLVEIIIVVAIMTVMTGLVSFGVGVVVSKPADECAQKLSNSLRNARVTAMGKLTCQVKISQEYDGAPIYLTVITNGSSAPTVKIGEKGVVCTYKTTDGSTGTLASKGTAGITIEFNRETGGFKTATIGSDTSKYISEFSISKGTINKIVKLSKLTGRVTVEE